MMRQVVSSVLTSVLSPFRSAVLTALLVAGVLGTVPTLAGAEGGSPGASAGAQAVSSGTLAATSTAVATDSTATPHRVIAYYFHTSQRCASCRKLEAFTTEAIQTGFTEELKDGRLVFRVVNTEEKENEHFVKEYKLFTKSVVLVDEQSGKQVAWKNLPKVWEFLVDRTKFIRYVQDETRGYLAGAKS